MLETVARSFDFSGTTGRRAFWSYAALAIGVAAVTTFIPAAGFHAKALLVVTAGFVGLPLLSATVRRLHDTGRSGWWVALNAVPFIGPLALLLLCAGRGKGVVPANWPARPVHLLGKLAVVVLALLYLSRFFWEPYWIPSGSMKPTLLPGDYLIATPQSGTPQPGQIVVFREETGVEFIFRVVARGGDTVEMRNGVLIVNGAPARQDAGGVFTEPRGAQGRVRVPPLCKDRTEDAPCEKDILIETLANGARYRTLDSFEGRFDNVEPLTVPAGHVFVLGDHRDNANDSRIPRAAGGRGPVPVDAITASAALIVFSSTGWLIDVTSWRPGRFLVRPD